ncbi:MAG: 50S ribosomal protein L17 [Bacteroidota bacterium]
MRHGDKVNNLGRKTAHRHALLMNLTKSLIEHKRIITTLAKAKALRVYAEPLITRSKVDSTNNRRVVFSYLQDKESIKELFGVIGDKVANRPGGYTRIIKLAPRRGDAAEMAMIELVDFNEIYTKGGKEADAKKTRRSRRSAAAKTTETAAPVAVAEEVVAPVAEAVEAPVAEVIEAPVTEVVTETPVAEATPEAPAAEEEANDTEETKA